MTRKVFGIALFITRLIDGCLSVSEIKDFVLKKYMVLKNDHEKNKELDNQLIELETNLAILGWIEPDELKQTKNKNNEEADRSNTISMV